MFLIVPKFEALRVDRSHTVHLKLPRSHYLHPNIVGKQEDNSICYLYRLRILARFHSRILRRRLRYRYLPRRLQNRTASESASESASELSEPLDCAAPGNGIEL